MLFLSLHPHHVSLHSSFHISLSLSPNNINNNSNNNNLNYPISLPIHKDSNSTVAPIKAPNPPWLKGPLLLQPHEILDFSKTHKRFNRRHVTDEEKQKLSDKALIGKEVRGKKALKRIAQKVEKLHITEKTQLGSEKVDNFEGYLEKLDENDDGNSSSINRRRSRRERMPWERDEKIVFLKMKKEKALTAAELNLDKVLLQKLRDEAAKMRKWVKVMKAGVTQDVVDEIKRIWRKNELAMIKFDIPLCRNMDRAREIVETKTGGLVVWSKKDCLVVYQGCNHQLTSKGSPKIYIRSQRTKSSEMNWAETVTKRDLYMAKSDLSTSDKPSLNADHKDSISTGMQVTNWQSVSGSLYERETDRLLDGLGPRFIDWWMHKPLPVDADLLPEVVPGFKPPFRLCPPYESVKLADSELTYLRKLAHPLPTHFVLGRNRGHQGLATSILKLWEKSLIAKIAIKYGAPNTDNETMAEELKHLTGGILLLRNKFYILLYRGKDFLPRKVAALVQERELELRSCQFHEETARTRAIEAIESISSSAELPQETSISGTFTEFKNIQTELGIIKKVNENSNIQLEAEICRLEKELKEEERKAFIVNKKIERSAMKLSKLNAAWTPSEKDADVEVMTDEERETFRKIGMRMDACLVLGRRGIFDGVMEGLHQHWKYREVVKVITMQRVFKQVIDTAKLLEAESGGILVTVQKLKEGHAILIYRGKNYKRPSSKVSKNLLTKREALRRSLEMQRIGSLKFFAHQRQQAISDLKLKLAELQKRKEIELGES